MQISIELQYHWPDSHPDLWSPQKWWNWAFCAGFGNTHYGDHGHWSQHWMGHLQLLGLMVSFQMTGRKGREGTKPDSRYWEIDAPWNRDNPKVRVPGFPWKFKRHHEEAENDSDNDSI